MSVATRHAHVSLAHRIRCYLRAWYLRHRIESARVELEAMQASYASLPAQMVSHRSFIEAWRLELTDCDLDTRRN